MSSAIGVERQVIWLINATSRHRRRLRLRRPGPGVVPNDLHLAGRPTVISVGSRFLVGECARSVRVGEAGVSVVGSLKSCLPFWRDCLKANDFVLDIIQHGYTIPFISEPLSAYAVNNKSALSHGDFVRKSIQDLLLSNVVREIDSPAYCCNPLTVATGSKLRLVLDLSRFVNPYVRYAHFKYEDWSVAEQIIQSQCWFFNWDFTSGYHHVSINSSQSNYLGFSFVWPEIGQRFFEFVQLPFGLISACYLFTKLTRPLIKYWRVQGFNVFIYIDDGLAVCDHHAQALNLSAQVQLDLSQAGFIVNQKKIPLGALPAYSMAGIHCRFR